MFVFVFLKSLFVCFGLYLLCLALCRPGSDLLSRVLRRSTIGAGEFHGRVRDGIGCISPRHDHQAGEGQVELTGLWGPEWKGLVCGDLPGRRRL